MMKKMFTATLVLSVMGSALASPTNDKSNKSYFDQLADLFANGTNPVIAKVANKMWSGRCFKKDAPNKAINSGFVLRQVAIDQDAGPIAADDEPTYEAKSFWDEVRPANYFDSFTFDQGVKFAPGVLFRAISENDVELVLSDVSSLRASGKYLVEEQLSNTVPAGWMCYYFTPEYAR